MKNFILLSAIIGAAIFNFSFERDSEFACSTTFGPERSGGLGAILGMDATGGPLSSGTCANCHSGGSFNPTISLQVVDNGGSPVTSYMAGATYTLIYTVTSGNGTPNGYGMQSVSLTSGNSGAGSIGSVLTPNTQKTTMSGIDYLEHQQFNPSGIFSADWTAPASGTGTVSFYAVGLAVNGNSNTVGDAVSSPITVNLTEQIITTTTIAYAQNPFCADAGVQTPTITGTQGGTFSSTPGLLLNPNSGNIDISSSTPGMYTITYTYSGGSTTTSITIHPTYNVNTSATICSYETYPFGNLTLTVADTGMNIATFQSINGCDSIVNLDLSATIIDTVVSYNAGVYSAAQGSATYQWIDCNNGNNPINGETSQTFSPALPGTYAVQITMSGCTEQSSCYTFVGIDELEQFGISVYPNPTRESWIINNSQGLIVHARLLDLNGNWEGRAKISYFNNAFNIDASRLPSGVYIVELETSKGIFHQQLIKQ